MRKIRPAPNATLLIILLLVALPLGTGLALPGVAAAQSLRPQGGSASPPMSLQTQLGAIPQISPRAQAKPSTVRTVRLTQLDAQQTAIGATREITCPESGCQLLIALVVAKASQSFIADIQFVGRGTYFALQSRSMAVSSVVEFENGRPGPVFIKDDDRGIVQRQVRFSMAAPGSVRALAGAPDPRTLSSGNVFTRKLDPDVILRVEIMPALPAK